jgi:hypothetical protein
MQSTTGIIFQLKNRLGNFGAILIVVKQSSRSRWYVSDGELSLRSGIDIW